MHSDKSSKIRLHWLVTTLLLVCLSLSVFTHVFLFVGQVDENYTYYGIVPSKILRYFLNDWNASPSWNDLNSGWTIGIAAGDYLGGSIGLNGTLIATKSLLTIVAAEDNTNVKVYDLTLDSPVSEGHINSMEKHLVLLANGTQFKVVSDKIVSVLLLNYQKLPLASATEGPLPHTFYISVDGLYVGKEFVLMASERTGVVIAGQTGTFYTILSLEKSTITITRDDGDQDTYTLDANTHKYLLLRPFRVYRIESTGNIMVQSGTISGKGDVDTPCFPVPSAEGGFVGQFFVTRSLKHQEWGWDPGRDYGYRILASEDTHVKVYDLETKQLMSELTVTGGNGVSIQPAAFAIAVQSDKPITLLHIHNGSIENSPTGGGGRYQGYGNGVMFISIRPNQDTMIHLPTEAYVEAYFFASEETQLTIDNFDRTIQADSPYLYTQVGTHLVRSNHNVILQINFWPIEPEFQGLWYRGTAIPCIETVNINPNVTLTPLEGFPITYVMMGAGVAVVATITGLLVMRRRRSKPS